MFVIESARGFLRDFARGPKQWGDRASALRFATESSAAWAAQALREGRVVPA
jgi:hypothetical protein